MRTSNMQSELEPPDSKEKLEIKEKIIAETQVKIQSEEQLIALPVIKTAKRN